MLLQDLSRCGLFSLSFNYITINHELPIRFKLFSWALEVNARNSPWWECSNNRGRDHKHKIQGLVTNSLILVASELSKHAKKFFISSFSVPVLHSDLHSWLELEGLRAYCIAINPTDRGIIKHLSSRHRASPGLGSSAPSSCAGSCPQFLHSVT